MHDFVDTDGICPFLRHYAFLLVHLLMSPQSSLGVVPQCYSNQ